MKALALALTILSYSPAFAAKDKPAPKPKPVEQPTPYSELASAWENGGPLMFDQIDGFYSGRCYERDAKSIMLPGLLAIQTYDAGPNFPKYSENYVHRFYYSEKYPAPDAFDLISTDEQKKKLFEQLPRFSRTISPAKNEEKGLTYSEYFNGTLQPALKAEARMSNGLVVLRYQAVAGVEITVRATGERKSFDAGATTEYCYFFKQIVLKTEISKYR